MKHVDAATFMQQACGSQALMVRIAQAFVGQLPGWRNDVANAGSSCAALSALMHKMKGSCHAVTATAAAESFAQAEKALQSPHQQPNATVSGILALVAELEADLTSLIHTYAAAEPSEPTS